MYKAFEETIKVEYIDYFKEKARIRQEWKDMLQGY